MEFADTDLENFFTYDLTSQRGGERLRLTVASNQHGRVTENFDLWYVDFDFDRDEVELYHDFDDRSSTYSIADFMAAVDAHVATLPDQPTKKRWFGR